MLKAKLELTEENARAVQRTVYDPTVNKIGADAVLAIDKTYGIACIDSKENDEHVPSVAETNAGRTLTASFFFS